MAAETVDHELPRGAAASRPHCKGAQPPCRPSPPLTWNVRRLPRADGRVLLVTGGNAGIGYFVAEQHWLMPLLTAASAARVVTMGSFAAKSERIDLADLQSRKDYQPKRAYGRSKLAQMHFGLELDRLLRAGRGTVTSLVVHPGDALDSLTPSRPPVHVRTSGARLRAAPAALLLQGKHAGAWPAVRAVLDPDVRGGHLWGPLLLGLRGKPRQEPVWNHLTDAWTAARLREASCKLTGVGLGAFPGQPHSRHTASGAFETAKASMTAPPPL
ncbi:hypothetical protein [Streptomyces sp. NPDC001450]